MVKAVRDIEIASGRAPNCTPPEHASEATPTEPCSPAPGRVFPASQPSTRIVTTEHVQQFLDILKSLSTQQGPPDSVKAAEGARTDAGEQSEIAPASKLEFKTVNEVYVSNGVIKLWLTIYLGGMRKSANTTFRNL